MAVLEAHGLYRFFHDGDAETAALKGVDLTIEAGDFVALMGPSGSGKSTLMSCLAGLDDPDGGQVTIMQKQMSRRPQAERARLRAQFIGMLMQSGNLLEHLSVDDNSRLQRQLARKGRLATEDWATRLGIADRRHFLPAKLSGGEAARAGLCVALAAQPAILLCDEPTAEVDRQTEAEVIMALREVAGSGVGVFVATHSDALASAANRIVRMRDGRVQA